MKKSLTALPSLMVVLIGLLAGCKSEVIVEPVGSPFAIKTVASQTNANMLLLEALVDSSGFGGAGESVTFYDDDTKLGEQTSHTSLTPTPAEQWDYKYSLTVPIISNRTYNIYSVVRWNANGVDKSLKSAVVKVSIP